MDAFYGTLALPDGRIIARPGWSPDPALLVDREKILASRFFLVRIAGNDGVGEMWRCRNCGGRHQFFSLRCIERPFCGLDEVLFALYQQAGDLAAVRDLDPRGQARHAAARAVITPVRSLPDLATLHPETARRLAAEQQIGAYDIELAGLRLGRAEQIPRSLAQRRLDQINSLRPIDNRLRVGDLEV